MDIIQSFLEQIDFTYINIGVYPVCPMNAR